MAQNYVAAYSRLGKFDMFRLLAWKASTEENFRCFYAVWLTGEDERSPGTMALDEAGQLPDFPGKPAELPRSICSDSVMEG